MAFLLPTLFGTSQSDKGDVHENVPEKNSLCVLSLFCDYLKSHSYLREREARVELRRRNLARVQTEMVEFIPLPFPFSSKLKIWSFSRRSCAGTVKKFTKKRDAHYPFCFLSLPVAVTFEVS